MAINQQIRKLAGLVWMRTGQPQYMLDTMRDDEVQSLAELQEPGGTVVKGFSEKVAAIINYYYESRKAVTTEVSPQLEPGWNAEEVLATPIDQSVYPPENEESDG